jgi:hypothetical protein
MVFIGWSFVVNPIGDVNLGFLIMGPFFTLLNGTLFAAPIVGWLLLMTGGVAGWLLYSIRKRLVT